MKYGFYTKLAWDNIKKNRQTYIPFILTSIGTTLMYYLMCYLALEQNTSGVHMTLAVIMNFGSWVIALFSVIFLFYSNSFLLKRRKQEFGVFNVLGMEKRHIARIVFLETVYVFLFSLAAGIAGGILFSKIMQLLVMKLMNFPVTFGFSIPAEAVIRSVILFGVIFFLIFLNSVWQVHRANPIELLSGSKTGEKEPKTKWLSTIVGAAALGAGYFMALTTKHPLEALVKFFIAVLLVMAGTYLLFISGSIALLKGLRRNKAYYYKTKHFTAVSGMIYRMKQNAVGLANICILSTAVLIMVSSTVSLYIGIEDVLMTRYPTDISVMGYDLSEEQIDIVKTKLEPLADAAGADHIEAYRYVFVMGRLNGDRIEVDDAMQLSNYTYLTVMSVTASEELTGETEELADGEMKLYVESGEYEPDRMTINEKEWKIVEKAKDFKTNGQTSAYVGESYYIIVPSEEDVFAIKEYLSPESDTNGYRYQFNFDMGGGEADQKAVLAEISAELDEQGLNYFAESREANRGEFFELYGGLFFLGIFLGVLFIMATVLIIYYKQVSEGYEDKKRFEIMQKVGMSQAEVKASIRSQILTVFYLPLVTACLHTLAAFPIITKLLYVLNLGSSSLFYISLAVSMFVFAVAYALIYSMTAKVYYKIVSK